MATQHSTERPTHRDDIASYFECCSDGFGKLAALARSIKSLAPEHSDLNKLADTASDLASDLEDIACNWGDEVTKNGVKND